MREFIMGCDDCSVTKGIKYTHLSIEIISETVDE